MAADKENTRTIVVYRRKGGAHGGSHGGSWKVAYADFVTAMMAFFLVMWIMGMDADVKDMVQGYFSNPIGFKHNYSGGATLISSGNSPVSMDMKRLALLSREYQRNRFSQAAQQIRKGVRQDAQLHPLQAQIQVYTARDGLRIEMMEDSGATFFRRGSAEPTEAGRRALAVVGAALADLPNDLIIDGHTDATPYTGTGGYTNWDLSTDRANAARRLLVAHGVAARRILEVRGYAARDPRIPEDPTAPSNRRVTITLPFKRPRAVEVARPLPGHGVAGRPSLPLPADVSESGGTS